MQITVLKITRIIAMTTIMTIITIIKIITNYNKQKYVSICT